MATSMQPTKPSTTRTTATKPFGVSSEILKSNWFSSDSHLLPMPETT